MCEGRAGGLGGGCRDADSIDGRDQRPSAKPVNATRSTSCTRVMAGRRRRLASPTSSSNTRRDPPDKAAGDQSGAVLASTPTSATSSLETLTVDSATDAYFPFDSPRGGSRDDSRGDCRPECVMRTLAQSMDAQGASTRWCSTAPPAVQMIIIHAARARRCCKSFHPGMEIC